MLLYGSIFFPSTGYTPVFTSRNDDNFGEKIQGVSGETDSNGDPTLHKASKAIWIYYVNFGTTINNARIRWAQRGVQYDANPGVHANHNLSNSLFQQCTTGVYCNLQGGTLYLSNVRKCNTTPMTVVTGSVSGSMTDDCGPLYTIANFAGIKQQGEPVWTTPDTMGAAGPSHFMVIVNGAVAVYDKYTGALLTPDPTTADSFFSLTVTSGPYQGTYPTICRNPPPTYGSVVDPRILFDPRSQRWFACAIDCVTSPRVLLAVSNGTDPVGNGGSSWVANNWKKYLVPFDSFCSVGIDFDTLGVDDNGIYIRVLQFGCSGPDLVAALPKGQYVSGTAPQVLDASFILPVSGVSGSDLTIQPAVNFGPVWRHR